MAFQPIVHADGHLVFGYEALVRSQDPVLSMPAELFAEAEALGRLRELERAIRRVVAQALPVAPADATIWVNLHPDSLDDEELVDPHGPLAPFARRIVLEITERSSLHATAGLEVRLAALRALGYRIAIDDLGAGYSGLNSFAVVVPEFVKYDRELVHDVEKSPTKARLLASMNAVCRELGITTVAEGVETEAERDTAVRLKCELLQGFWLGRPERGFVLPKRC
jgi:EAL domain-containing protein (putative c-di-GMP-specific phosphodiesterase class I)